jgi:hypothetical protein
MCTLFVLISTAAASATSRLRCGFPLIWFRVVFICKSSQGRVGSRKMHAHQSDHTSKGKKCRSYWAFEHSGNKDVEQHVVH